MKRSFILVLISTCAKGSIIRDYIRTGEIFSDYTEACNRCKELNNGQYPCWIPCDLIGDRIYMHNSEYEITDQIIEAGRVSGCWIEAIQTDRRGIKAYYHCETLAQGWSILKEYSEGCMLSIFYEPEEMQEGDDLICKTFDDLIKYIYG